MRGEAFQNAFSVIIDENQSVYDLKEVIMSKTQQKVAQNLILWKVKVTDDMREKIDELNAQHHSKTAIADHLGGKVLDSTEKIGTVFKRELINIVQVIVEISSKSPAPVVLGPPAPAPDESSQNLINSSITIFCLIRGESIQSAFPVLIDENKIVHDLKEAIALKNPQIGIVATHDLILWKVEVSDNKTEEFDKLNAQPDFETAIAKLLGGKALLNPMEKIGAVFKRELNIVQVIVEIPSNLPVTVPASGITLASLLVRRIRNLNQATFSHNFYDRRNFLDTVIPVVSQNKNKQGSKDFKDHTMILIPGGSGIGKSRAGWEMQHLVTHADKLGFEIDDPLREALENPSYFHIDLNDSTLKYNRQFDENFQATTRIGARLAIASGLITTEIMQSDRLQLFRLDAVIQEILKRRFEGSNRTAEALIIHIDEYQIYIDKAMEGGSRSWNQAREFFKSLLAEISTIMRYNIEVDGHPDKQYFVVPICTGSSAIDIHFLPTENNKVMVSLAPLDYTSAKEMFLDKYEYSRQTTDRAKNNARRSVIDHYGGKTSDRDISNLSTDLCNLILEKPHFKIALQDTGFIPKFIDLLLQPEYLEVNLDWGQILFNALVIRTANQLGSWKAIADMHIVISLGLTRMVVSRNFMLPSKMTIGEVEREGLIYLATPVISNVPVTVEDPVIVVMPFMLMKVLNGKLLGDFIFPEHLLLIPTNDHPWQWQEFEILLGYYQRAIIRALIDIRAMNIQSLETEITRESILVNLASAKSRLVEEKKKKWRLSDVFRGAIGDDSLLQREVLLHNLKVFTEKERFLVTTTDTAHFSDEVLCSDGIIRHLTNGIYRSAVNNASVDYRWAINTVSENPLAIFMQVKHSALETKNPRILPNEVHAWYKRTLRSVRKYEKDYDVVLVYFTNRWCDADNLPHMSKLLLIDQTCLEKYLSPTFAHRGLMEPSADYKPEEIASLENVVM